MQSEQIEKISAALSKAQAEIQGAIRDSKNPFFKSSYADLASVWGAIRKPLTDNELAIVQTTDQQGDDMYLVTQLVHSSGQWFSSIMKLIMGNKRDMQALGSAITYARRYSLAAIMGVPQVDDDGNACSAPGNTAQPQPMQKQAPKQSSRMQLRTILANLTDGFKSEERSDLALQLLEISSFKEINNKSDEEINKMIELLKENYEHF